LCSSEGEGEEEEPMLLQHNNARPHISAATTVVKEKIRFQVVPHPSYSPDLVPSDFWLFVALMKHLKGIHFTCDAEVQLLRENGFKKSLKSSPATGLKNMFSASLVLNERQSMWKNKVQEQSTYSKLYFMLCFISISCLAVKIQTLRHYFPNILHNNNKPSFPLRARIS
jgi:hypothetical protein